MAFQYLWSDPRFRSIFVGPFRRAWLSTARILDYVRTIHLDAVVR